MLIQKKSSKIAQNMLYDLDCLPIGVSNTYSNE